jgi:hypothetical protein
MEFYFYFLLILAIIILFYFYFYKKLEHYNEPLVQFFMKHFNREPDLLSSLYYHNISEMQMNKELILYKNKVDIGKDFLKTKKIILTGLIRNKISNINYLKLFYNDLKNYCNKIIFIIVENDSDDNTRIELLKWTNFDDSIILLCENDEINKTVCNIKGFEIPILESHPFPNRICKLTYLRNLYINYIYQKFSMNDFDYLFVKDLDLNGNLFLDGLFESMYYFKNDGNISGIGCNGLIKDIKYSHGIKYYDSFAYVELNDNHIWDNDFDKQSHDEDVLKYIVQKYINNLKLDHVLSAFGGFCIYNMTHLFNIKPFYDCSKDNKLFCEHAYFNKQLLNIYVNPKMIYMIDNY